MNAFGGKNGNVLTLWRAVVPVGHDRGRRGAVRNDQFTPMGHSMDKKLKKKTHVLQQRIQALRQQLAGARKQMDDQGELKSIEQQLASAEAELAKIKDS
jgi:hypothetical protein